MKRQEALFAEAEDLKASMDPGFNSARTFITRTLREHPRYRQGLHERGLYNLGYDKIRHLPVR